MSGATQKMLEDTWQAGCEFLVGEAYSGSEFTTLHDRLRVCYQIEPDPLWTKNDVQSGDMLNITTIVSHYSKHTNIPTINLSHAITSYNKQYPPANASLNCGNVERAVVQDRKQVEEQFAYALKHSCDIPLILQNYNGHYTFDQQFKIQLIGIAWRFENFGGVQALSQAFNVSIWHREIAHPYKLHTDNDYRIIINSVNNTDLKSVLTTVFLSESQPQSRPGSECEVLCSHIYSDIKQVNQTQFAAIQSNCEHAINHYSVRDLVEYINRYLDVTNGRVRIYITHGNARNSFYSPPHLGDPIKHEVVFVSSRPEARFPLLLHESGHLFFHKLFRYQEKPYTRHDHKRHTSLYNDFIRAKNRFVSEFCSKILGFQCSRAQDFRGKEIILAAKAYFHNSLGERDLALNYLRQVSYDLLQVARRSSIEDRFTALERWVKNKWGTEHQDIIHFAHRVFDWATRPDARHDIELLNRVPELRARITDQRVLDVLASLEAFWQKHISPLLTMNSTFPSRMDRSPYRATSPTLLSTLPAPSTAYLWVGTIVLAFLMSAATMIRRGCGRKRHLKVG